MSGDIVKRLRSWVHAVDAVPASDLMDEAAAEITRLRLTDAEREAVAWAASLAADGAYVDHDGTNVPDRRVALRGLLERLG